MPPSAVKSILSSLCVKLGEFGMLPGPMADASPPLAIPFARSSPVGVVPVSANRGDRLAPAPAPPPLRG